jgi:hypothetical protein
MSIEASPYLGACPSPAPETIYVFPAHELQKQIGTNRFRSVNLFVDTGSLETLTVIGENGITGEIIPSR